MFNSSSLSKCCNSALTFKAFTTMGSKRRMQELRAVLSGPILLTVRNFVATCRCRFSLLREFGEVRLRVGGWNIFGIAVSHSFFETLLSVRRQTFRNKWFKSDFSLGGVDLGELSSCLTRLASSHHSADKFTPNKDFSS